MLDGCGSAAIVKQSLNHSRLGNGAPADPPPRKEPTISQFELSDAERRFCRSIAAGLTPSAAAVAASYHASMGPELLKRRGVVAVLRELHAHVGRVIDRATAGPKPRGTPALNDAAKAMFGHLEANAKAVTASVAE